MPSTSRELLFMPRGKPSVKMHLSEFFSAPVFDELE